MKSPAVMPIRKSVKQLEREVLQAKRNQDQQFVKLARVLNKQQGGPAMSKEEEKFMAEWLEICVRASDAAEAGDLMALDEAEKDCKAFVERLRKRLMAKPKFKKMARAVIHAYGGNKSRLEVAK